jgi:hypothetical protein
MGDNDDNLALVAFFIAVLSITINALVFLYKMSEVN